MGIRSIAGLASAIAQPQASFGNEDLHPTLVDKAAAYAFHIAEAQAFVDGNKRVALATSLTFMAANGYEFTEDQSVFYNAIIAISVLANQHDFIKGPVPILRDSLHHPDRGFYVQDGNYISARWPGDVILTLLTALLWPTNLLFSTE